MTSGWVHPTDQSPRGRRYCVAVAWALGIAAILALRWRGSLSTVRALHRWLADLGVPDAVRNLDSVLICAAAAGSGALLVAKRLRCMPLALLGIRRGLPGWPSVVIAAAMPMVVGGLVLGWQRHGFSDGLPWSPLFAGVVRAPIAEELLFRGLLVALVVAAVGTRGLVAWASIVASGLAFGALHVDWNVAALQRDWPTLLVTVLGGVWYGWLLLRWQTLFVPLLLHAAMNLGWLLAAAKGGAGGGGLGENLLRIATIAIATVGTVRCTRAAAVCSPSPRA